MPSDATSEPKLAMASVLFMDIVGYSKLPMDQGTRLVEELTEIVEGTEAFTRAKSRDQLVMVPTGDGMALAFFGDPVAPVQCAIEVSRKLRAGSEIHLRTGVHTGPVYRTLDINKASNVAGGGVNLAQRVMDCGDDGHILISQSVTDVLQQLSEWQDCVHDIGVIEVKHGEKIRVFNLYGDGFGNPDLPNKAQRPEPPTVQTEKKGTALKKLAAVAVAALLLAVVLGYDSLYCRLLPNLPGCEERSFTYWITLQRFRNGEYGPASKLPGPVVFEAQDLIYLHVESTQDGHIYLINEGPDKVNGLPSYNLLFPEPNAGVEASFLKAGQPLDDDQASIIFDDEEGTERLRFVWAAKPVPAIEQANPSEYGVIVDPDEKKAIQEFLATAEEREPDVIRSEEEKQTFVKGSGDILVHLVRLAHY